MGLNYKYELIRSMDMLAADAQTRFIGYGLKGGAMGTLANVPENRLTEVIVAENLMVSLAIGMSMMGFKPVVYLERADFIHCAMDAIVNHLNAIKKLSCGEFAPACILRVTVGNKSKPNFTGPIHTADNAAGLAELVDFPVLQLKRAEDIYPAYLDAYAALSEGRSTALFEYKDKL